MSRMVKGKARKFRKVNILVKEEISDFLKTAYKYGKVKDVKEAFEEYPVEEEWHKGKIENILKKDNTNNLHKNSIVKTDVVYKILNEQILFKIGKVDNEKIEEYKKNFYNNLKSNSD